MLGLGRRKRETQLLHVSWDSSKHSKINWCCRDLVLWGDINKYTPPPPGASRVNEVQLHQSRFRGRFYGAYLQNLGEELFTVAEDSAATSPLEHG